LGDEVRVERMVTHPTNHTIREIAFAFMAKIFDAYGAPDLTDEGYLTVFNSR
jgi:hypothetical protein